MTDPASKAGPPDGPLAGVRVIDLTRLLPGPYCTLLLADMGADVVRIEDPKAADFVRWLPPLLGKRKQLGAIHVALHRGKRSVALDLKADAGREALLRLLDDADVLVEGFRPGVLDRLGIGYGVLSAWNPRLVVCSISGYGQTGPYRDRAGHDIDYLALAGLLGQVGHAGERPGPPGFQVGDIGGGSLLAALRIVAALLERGRTGRGAWLDVSMTEGAAAFSAMALGAVVAGGAPPRQGREQLNGGLVSYDVYETKDGRHMALGALEPKFWAAFCKAVGRPDWIPRQAERVGDPHSSPIVGEVRALFASRTRDEWVALLRDHDACCEPVLSVDEVLDHAVNAARRPRLTLHHPTEGELPAVRTPVFDPERADAAGPPALLGEHTREVLAEAGLSEAEVEALLSAGVARAS